MIGDDNSFVPASVRGNHLRYRQRIKKFVRHDKQWRIGWHRFHIIMENGSGHSRPLFFPQSRAILDKMNLWFKSETLHCSTRIGSQRAPARSKLDIITSRRTAPTQPDIAQPNPDHFAEHLTNLWRRYEVAIGTQRISAAIICGVCHAHIFGNTYGARRFNFLREAQSCRLRVRQHYYAACANLP
jgi:hypothetical protein